MEVKALIENLTDSGSLSTAMRSEVQCYLFTEKRLIHVISQKMLMQI